jgi:phosphoglycerate dehydrogenase-like enzyme
LGKDLRTLPNVIMTPHISSSTHEACDRMAGRALRNIQLAEAGKYDEMDLLNPEVLAKLELRR